jgi:hypothetical protein
MGYGRAFLRPSPKEACAMAASPVSIVPTVSVRRRPLALTQRRIEANRRNAARSTGPRTAEGKARVARNPIKHGFFVARERWTPKQHRDFEETLDGLRDDLKPQGALEEGCVRTMADSFVRMAAMLRYENIAALKYHQHRERELNGRIAAADAAKASSLEAARDQLRRARLWRPTIPGPREAIAIARYSGSLDRTIHRASSELQVLKNMRITGASSSLKLQKQTHFEAPPRTGPEAAEGPRMAPRGDSKPQKQTHYEPAPISVLKLGEGPRRATFSTSKSEKTNPLSSMFTGNRHQRRRAKALAARRR